MLRGADGIVAGAAALVVLACGGAPAARTGERAAETIAPLAGRAVELVGYLPASSTSCTVVNLEAVPDALRPLVGTRSMAPSFLWSAMLPASTIAVGHDPTGQTVAALPAGDLSALRAFLDGPFDVAVRGGVVLGRIGEHFGGRGDARSRCAAALVAHPGAIEVAVVDDRGLPDDDLSTYVIERSDAGIRRRHILERVGDLRRREYFSEDAVGTTTFERTDAGFVRTTHLRWEDLELLLEDRERAFRTRSERGPAPAPLDELDFTQADVVAWERRQREELLAAARGDERRPRALELAAFLERGWTLTTNDVEYAAPLVRLLLDELGEGAEAMRICDEVIALAAGDEARWRWTRRKAAAFVSEDALAAALRDDGVLAASAARRVAGDLAAIVAARGSYEVAEDLVVAANTGPGARGPLRPSSGAPALEVRVLLETILLTVAATHRERAGALTSYFVRLRAAGAVLTPVIGAPPAVLFLTTRPSGDREWIGSGMLGPSAGAEIDRALHARIADGHLELSVDVVAPGLARPIATVTLAGDVAGGVLRVLRVDRGASSIRWDRVGQRISAPLSMVRARIFPAPDLRVAAPHLDAVHAAAAGVGLTCDARSGELICEGVDPDAAAGFLYDAAPLLLDASR